MIRWCDNGHAPTRVQSGARCMACVRRREAGRLPPAMRGYDAAHRAARAELVGMLPMRCAYGCGTWLRDARDMVAAHVVDGDPTQGWVASCRACNERAKVRA